MGNLEGGDAISPGDICDPDAVCELVEGDDAHADQVGPHAAIEEVVFDRGDCVWKAVDGLGRGEGRRVDDQAGDVVQVWVGDEVGVDGVEHIVCELETRPRTGGRRPESPQRRRDGQVLCVDVSGNEVLDRRGPGLGPRPGRWLGRRGDLVLRVELQQKARLHVGGAVLQDVDEGRQARAGVND